VRDPAALLGFFLHADYINYLFRPTCFENVENEIEKWTLLILLFSVWLPFPHLSLSLLILVSPLQFN
jgi:hypothetical protein